MEIEKNYNRDVWGWKLGLEKRKIMELKEKNIFIIRN